MKKDYLVRALSRYGKVRAFAVRCTTLMEEIRVRNDTWPVASAALGRTVAVGAMMGAMLKGEERVSVIIKGGGPIGQIIVDANAKGEIRGTVTHPHIHFPLNEHGKLDVARAVGTDGFITVTKDLGLKDPYHGSVELVSGEIGEDFTYYFARSEQTPSAVSVGVLVNEDHSIRAAGGFILQVMPGLSDEDITQLEENLRRIKPVSKMIDEGMTPEEILKEVLGEDVELLASMDVYFSCHCSRERVEGTLISLGIDEISEMIEDKGQAEVVCHFCNEKYEFDKPELKRLLELANK